MCHHPCRSDMALQWFIHIIVKPQLLQSDIITAGRQLITPSISLSWKSAEILEAKNCPFHLDTSWITENWHVLWVVFQIYFESIALLLLFAALVRYATCPDSFHCIKLPHQSTMAALKTAEQSSMKKRWLSTALRVPLSNCYVNMSIVVCDLHLHVCNVIVTYFPHSLLIWGKRGGPASQA